MNEYLARVDNVLPVATSAPETLPDSEVQMIPKNRINVVEVELTGEASGTVTFWREDGEGRQYRYTPVNLLRLIGVVNDLMILDKGLVFATDIGWEYHPTTPPEVVGCR